MSDLSSELRSSSDALVHGAAPHRAPTLNPLPPNAACRDEEDDFLLGRHASVSESEFGADEHSVAPRTCRFTDWVVRRTWLIAAVVSLIALTCTIVAFAVCPPNVDLYEHSDAFTIGNHPSVVCWH